MGVGFVCEQDGLHVMYKCLHDACTDIDQVCHMHDPGGRMVLAEIISHARELQVSQVFDADLTGMFATHVRHL